LPKLSKFKMGPKSKKPSQLQRPANPKLKKVLNLKSHKNPKLNWWNPKSLKFQRKPKKLPKKYKNKIEEYVLDLYQKIKERKDLHFLITKIGCGLAGYNIEDIAPMFKAFIKLENCSLPEEFIKYNTKKRKKDE